MYLSPSPLVYPPLFGPMIVGHLDEAKAATNANSQRPHPLRCGVGGDKARGEHCGGE